MQVRAMKIPLKFRAALLWLSNALRIDLHEVRWLLHVDRWRVPRAQRAQYRAIFDRTWKQLGCNPNIFYGNDYNNKVKWLMLFDQRPEMVRCADKLAVRDYVRETVGEQYLNALYGVWDRAEDIDFDRLPGSFVIKTNHDSGSVWIVRDKASVNLDEIKTKCAARLFRQKYGIEKGEWCYQYIEPKVFAEEYLEGGAFGIPDYKFYCSLGSIKFVKYIHSRQTNKPVEVVVDNKGAVIGESLNSDFLCGKEFVKPNSWIDMLNIAENLSREFIHVRVDLYDYNGEPRFGELTFFPLNGNYKSAYQKEIGKLFPIDRSVRRPPYVHLGA